jgi:hypothetical protein
MPLTANSPVYLHIFQNLSLFVLALLFVPVSSIVLVISILTSSYRSFRREVSTHGKHESQPAPCPAPKTILVTGVGMTKGLFIARSFHKSGHTVIGADFEPHYIPVCGRFSSSLKKFYRLPSPSSGRESYKKRLIEIIHREKVDLWISCSGVMSAVQDGEAAEAVEKYTNCKAVQFGTAVTQTLHEKHSFIEKTESLGLNVPETLLITSVDDGMEVLDSVSKDKKYILKSVGVDDSVRADMTLLPLSSDSSTCEHLSNFRPSMSRPFVLQQFVRGPEYCTHAIIIHGRVAAFTACKSAELLMHYDPLPQKDPIFKAMLEYTETYVQRMRQDNTGHFSMDFLFDETDSSRKLEKRIFPIECNPRAHTAVVNFGNDTEGMVNAYLSATAPGSKNDVFIPSSDVKHYWIGHNIVTRFFLPGFWFLIGKSPLSDVLEFWRELREHLVYWRDPTYEIEDPWPAWWLYCVYWPSMFLLAIVKRKWWSRCNVSTGKIFQC